MIDDWHSLKLSALLGDLETTDEGLNSEEATKRLKTYGYNELIKKKKKHPIFTFFDQFRDPLVIILLAALGISVSIGILSHDPQEKFEYFFDSIAITAIVMFNALFGFIQEYKAEKSIEVLKSMAAPYTTVIRDGKKQRIEARLLVPGDIIIVEEGDKIPADSRLIQAVSLRVDESTLTGESFPVAKDVSNDIDKYATLGDRINSLFSGTVVTRGRGQAVIVKTGMETEFGRIAKGLMEEDVEETPLQKRLSTLGKWLGIASLLICGVIFSIGVLLNQGIINMFIVSVGLAVAAVPEGLPAVVTLALALGVQRMSKKNAIIRRLPSVETLGSTTVICSDKTGTLTENKMTVRKIITTDSDFILSDDLELDYSLKTIINIGLACNNAQIASESDNKAVDIGDPTEIALLKLAAQYGVENEFTRLYEVPFDSNAKRMSVVVKNDQGDHFVFMKGAPDVLLDLCKYYFSNGEVMSLDRETRSRLEQNVQNEAQSGYRMLGMAYKAIPEGEIDVKLVSEDVEEIEADLIYIGSVAIMDPPRPGTKASIETCIQAGIRPIMITGDHLKTAVAVANEIGLIDNSDNTQKFIEGKQLSEISDEELQEIVKNINVYARVSPEHKLRLVNALKSNNEIVAMTGDGVNDAPALKRADIGVAMGISGTDVSKEASDMILADDDFSTIVAAILEGRTIYDNMRKFILYLLSCNAGEIMVMFLGIILTSFLFGEPILPLVAIQILWVNLVTDGLPALALGVDPPDPDIMVRKPRDPNESILTRKSVFFIIYSGIVIGVLTLLIFLLYLPQDPQEITHARTMAFTLLILFQMIMALNIRKEEHSLLGKEFFRNPYLLIAIASSIMLHLIVVYVPFLNPFFDTMPLGIMDWIIILTIGSILVVVDEIRTFISHHFEFLRNIAGYW
ncbi:MAG: calcium-translocating P-type ATPase, PMCA-type [Candidatus Hodarchaeales archaeon]